MRRKYFPGEKHFCRRETLFPHNFFCGALIRAAPVLYAKKLSHEKHALLVVISGVKAGDGALFDAKRMTEENVCATF
jgi:hypothetical protein